MNALKTRVGSTVAIVAATLGLAAGVAGPIYSAFGGGSASADAAPASTAGRIMR